MNIVCAECGKDFESRKGLHLHLKTHFASMGEYYAKHFPKFDKFSHEPIQFKKYEQYEQSDFNNYANYLAWLKSAPNQEARSYSLRQAENSFREKDIKTAPPHLYYKIAEMADCFILADIWGSYGAFLKELGIPTKLNKRIPMDFWERDCSDIEIFIDTREQLPLSFKNSLSNKLDFGDYAASGELYSKTFVDRKSASDFKGTFGAGLDRFKREMDRCVHFGSYMFVVVESTTQKIEEENNGKFKSNMSFIWHNVRDVIRSYPDNIQFIFSHSRKGSEKLIPKILFYGQSLWNVDLQYFLERRTNGLD